MQICYYLYAHKNNQVINRDVVLYPVTVLLMVKQLITDMNFISTKRTHCLLKKSPPISPLYNVAPKTTNNAPAVIISRIRALEIKRNSGFINHFPATVSPTTALNAMPIDIQLVCGVASFEWGARKATEAKSGTIAISSKLMSKLRVVLLT